jgi:hypothetical protein
MNRLARASAVLAVSVGVVLTATGCAGDTAPGPTVTVTATATVTANPIDVIEDTVNSLTEFVMPDLVGVNLQDAQDLLQDKGSFLMDQQDASGKGRRQIDDSNWTVCSQDPAPGAVHSKLAIVTLSSVKNDEACP